MRGLRGRCVLLALVVVAQMLAVAQSGPGTAHAAVPPRHGAPAVTPAAHGVTLPPPRFRSHSLTPAPTRPRRHIAHPSHATTSAARHRGAITSALLLRPPVASLPAVPAIAGTPGSQAQRLRPNGISPAIAKTYVVPSACGGAPGGAIVEPDLGTALVHAVNGDTIDLCSGGTYGVPSAANGAVVSQSTLTIQGLGAAPADVVVDAGLSSSGTVQSGAFGFYITGHGDTIANLTVIDATNSGVLVHGGAAGVILNLVTASGNNQAGLMVSGGTATVTNSNFDANNYAATGIGAVLLANGTLHATGTSFDGNYVGIWPRQSSTISLTTCTVDNNRWVGVDVQGGGSLTSTGTSFDNDHLAGLAVAVPAGGNATTLSLTGGEARGNTGVLGVSGFGYGIGLVGATATTIDVTGMKVTGNTTGIAYVGTGAVSPGTGGGLVNDRVQHNAGDGLNITAPGTLTVSGGTYSLNDAEGIEVGTVDVPTATTSVIVTLSSVSAGNNGDNGIYDGVSGTVSITGTSTFDGNQADGIYIDTTVGNVTIGDATSAISASGNDANCGCAGIDLYGGGTDTLVNVTASANQGDGVYHAGDGDISITGRSTFDGNQDVGVNVDTTAGDVTIGNATSAIHVSGNDEDCGCAGIWLTSSGTTTLVNVTASTNLGYGLDDDGSGSINITGDSSFDTNLLDGIFVDTTVGDVTIGDVDSTIEADGNNQGCGCDGGVTLSSNGTDTLVNVTASYNQGPGILDTGTGAISITGNSTVDANAAPGIVLGDPSQPMGDVTIGDDDSTIVVNGNGLDCVCSGDGIDLASNGTATLANVTASANDGDGLYYAGLATLSVDESQFTQNGADGLLTTCGGSSCTLDLNASTLQGNIAGAGLEIGGGGVALDTTPTAPTDTNLLNGNLAGVLISAPTSGGVATTVTGSLVRNDLTGNEVGIDVDPGDALLPDGSSTGESIDATGLTVRGNAIYGGGDCTTSPSPFACVASVLAGTRPPPLFRVSPLAQPDTTEGGYPAWYGYLNLDTSDPSAALNLDGNDFGIGGTYGTNDFDASYAAPSVCPSAGLSPTNYCDIGGPYLGSGPYVTLSVCATTCTATTSSVRVNVTLNDGAGNEALNGTPLDLYVYDLTQSRFLTSTSAPPTGNIQQGTFSSLVTLSTAATSGDSLLVLVSAPDRMVADSGNVTGP